MPFVYFFRETGREFVKIGMTDADDVKSRFAAFRMYAPLGAYIAGVIKTSNAAGLEKEIHEEYTYKRKQGEFFEMTDAEVEMLVNRYDNTKNGKLASAMNEWLANNNYDEDRLIRLLRDNMEQPTEDHPQKQQVLEIVKELAGQKMTNTEINDLLKNAGIEVSHTALGIILRDAGYDKKPMRVRLPYHKTPTVRQLYIL